MSFVRVKDNVYLLRVPHGGTTTGVILLDGEKKYLIDAAGTSNEVDTYILPALSELSLSLSDIECLLCTHTHGDHIGGFYRLRQLGVKRIAAYTRSVPKIKDPLTYNIEIRKAFPKNSPPPSSSMTSFLRSSVTDEPRSVRFITASMRSISSLGEKGLTT